MNPSEPCSCVIETHPDEFLIFENDVFPSLPNAPRSMSTFFQNKTPIFTKASQIPLNVNSLQPIRLSKSHFQQKNQQPTQESKGTLSIIVPESRKKSMFCNKDSEMVSSPFVKRDEKPKMYAFISKLFLTKKFMRSLRNATVFRKPTWLRNFHFQIINDLSFIGHSFDFERKGNKVINWIINIITRILTLLSGEKGVLNPSNITYIFFEFILLILTIACLIIIPMDLGFSIDFLAHMFPDSTHYFAKRLAFFLFFLDILLNFNTPYYEKGELIKKRSMIIKNYLKTSFLRDILSIVYFFWGIESAYPYENSLQKISGVLFILRTRNVIRILSRIEEFLFLDEKIYNYLLFFKLIFRIVLLSHFFACIWHFIGINTRNSWIETMSLNSATVSWEHRYLLSFYYIVVVMNTVGFGDITPKNSYEISFTIVFIYCACGLFAYTINSIGLILQQINNKERELKRNMNTLNGYMRRKKIHLKLRTKIRNFLEYVWHEDQVDNEEAANEIMKKLSRSLREELLLNANGVLLKNFKIFHRNFTEESLRKMVYIMKEVKYIPGDIIYSQNEISEPCLYIIKKGKVEFFIETTEKQKITVESLKKHQLFGELSFFSDKPRETTAKCTTFTSLYAIKRQNFIEILKEKEEDYETFSMIKDQINLYKNVSKLYIQCRSCKESTHFTLFCPFLNYIQSHQRVLQKYNYSCFQNRMQYQRLGKKKKRNKYLTNFYQKKANIENSYNDSSFSSNNCNESNLPSKAENFETLQKLESNQNLNLSNEKFQLNSQISSPIRPPKKIKRALSLPNVLPSAQMKRRESRRFNVSIHEEKNFNLSSNSNFERKSLFDHSRKNMASIKDFGESKQQKLKSILSFREKTSEKIKSFNTTEKESCNFIFEESFKKYAVYLPYNNFEQTIEEANLAVFLNLKRKKMMKSKLIKKTWYEWAGAKKSDAQNSQTPLRMKISEGNFFKKIESQMSQPLSKRNLMKILKENKIGKQESLDKKIRSFFKKKKKEKGVKQMKTMI